MRLPLPSLFLALSLLGVQATQLAAARTVDLGVIGTSGATFTNSFNTAGSFTDHYTFTLDAGLGGVEGNTLDTAYRYLVSRDVQLVSLVLTNLGTGVQLPVDDTPAAFSFSNLLAGQHYQLTLSGNVLAGAGSRDGKTSGNYAGTIQTILAAPSVASGAPEASDLAMAVMGLAGVAAWSRRRRSA